MFSFLARASLWMTLIGFLLSFQLAEAQIYSTNFAANATGWKLAPVGYGGTWKWFATGGVGNGGSINSNEVKTNATPGIDTNWYAASPYMALQAGLTYRLSLKCSVNSANKRSLNVGFHTLRTKIGATGIITGQAIPINTYNTYQQTFTVPTTGSYNLVIWGGFISSQYSRIYVDDFLVELANVPPTVSISAPSNNSSSTLGYPVILSANANDTDGTVSSVEFFANGNSLGTDNSAPFSLNWNPAATGIYSLTARATDNLGSQTTSSAVSITVNANTAPTVSLSSPANTASFLRGNTVSMAANASDAEGSVSKVEFFVNGSKIGEDVSTPYSLDWTATGLGNQTLAVSATDDLGLTSDQSSISITVNNNAPSASISSPAAGASFARGTTVSISTDATDMDGTVSKVEFFVNGSNVGEDLTSPYAFDWTPTGLGAQSLTIIATDNDGATTTSGAVSITTTNVEPITSISSPPANSSFARGSSISISANASDADGTVSKVEFFVNGSKVGEDLTSPFAFDWTATGLGSQSLTTIATDNDGATATSATIAITTTNVAPTASISSPAPNATFARGSSVSISANASDADGTVSKVEFFVNGSKVGEDLTSPFGYDWTATGLGSQSLTTLSTDNDGATTTSAAVSIITTNVAPTTSISSPVANVSFARGSSVAISASATDADGTVSKVEFFVNGSKVGEDLTSPFAFSWTASGTVGSKDLTAIASDNDGGTTSSSTVSILVTNVNPTVTLGIPSNGSSFVFNESITLSANAADADGSVSKVEFFVNGIKIGQSLAAPFNFTWVGAAQTTHSIQCLATDNDGGTTSSNTNNITVGAYAAQTLLNWDFAANATGWVFSTGAGGNDWKWYNNVGVGGLGGLRNKFSNTNNTNWAIAPLVSLNAGSTYALSVDARIEQGTGSRQLEMLYNTSPSLTGATSFFVATMPTNSYAQPPFLTYTGKFTPPTSGTYYIILRSLGGGYTFMYLDNVLLEKNFSPTISFTAPANNSSVLEYNNVNLTVNASDPDGIITKVEYFANGSALGNVTVSPFSFTWNQPLPGNYTLTAKVTDNKGNSTTSTPLNTTVNFTNGTLSKYVDYRFDAGLGDWTFVRTNGDNNAIRHRPTTGWNNSGILQLFNVNNTSYATSPALFLSSGQSYSLEFRSDVSSSGRNVVIQYNTAPGLGGTNVITFTPTTTEDYLTLRTASFTVPANGIYYMNIYVSNTTGGYQQLGIDNFRIVGELNQCPITKLTYPSSALTIAEGASITFTASSVDYDGSVTKVEFYDDGVKLGEDASSPYSFVWNNVPLGSHPIRAVGIDNEGVALGSTIVNVYAGNPGFTASSFLGGTSSVDDVRGTVIQKNGTVVIAANISDAAPGGISPTLLNGASATTSGAIIRMNATGKQVLSVTRLADKIVDLSEDSSDNLYVSAASQGMFKLNATASQILWSKTYTANCHRVDAGLGGYSVVLTSATSNYDDHNALTGVGIWVYDPAGTQTASYGGLLQYTPDVCIDEASQTVISVGFKNIISNTSDGAGNQPVVIPYIQGRDYNGVVKYTAYNWDGDSTSPNYLNKPALNMADTRASKAAIGKDGKLYVGYEVAGGNHPIRYSPFDIMTPVIIVGGDNFSTFSNTGSEHKLVVARYEPGTGNYLLGQQFCGRTSTGTGNSVFVGEGNLDADQDGRVYVTGASASGIPFTMDHLPGQYSGGAFVLVLSPNMATREQVVRVSTAESHAIGVRNRNHYVVGGSSKANPVFFAKDPIQAAPANTTDNGWFAVYYQNGGNARLAVSEPVELINPGSGKSIQYRIYPNPSMHEDIHVRFKAGDEVIESEIQLMDLQGRRVAGQSSNAQETSISTKGLKAGLYFMKIKANGVEKVERVVIQ